jgi:hypothetical protein
LLEVCWDGSKRALLPHSGADLSRPVRAAGDDCRGAGGRADEASLSTPSRGRSLHLPEGRCRDDAAVRVPCMQGLPFEIPPRWSLRAPPLESGCSLRDPPRWAPLGAGHASAWPRDCAPDSGLPGACEASRACCRSNLPGVSRALSRPPLPLIVLLSQEPSDPGLSAFPSRPGRSGMLWKGAGVIAAFPREEEPSAEALGPATMPVVD